MVLVKRASLDDAHAIIVCKVFQNFLCGSCVSICVVHELCNALFELEYQWWLARIIELDLSWQQSLFMGFSYYCNGTCHKGTTVPSNLRQQLPAWSVTLKMQTSSRSHPGVAFDFFCAGDALWCPGVVPSCFDLFSSSVLVRFGPSSLNDMMSKAKCVVAWKFANVYLTHCRLEQQHNIPSNHKTNPHGARIHQYIPNVNINDALEMSTSH